MPGKLKTVKKSMETAVLDSLPETLVDLVRFSSERSREDGKIFLFLSLRGLQMKFHLIIQMWQSSRDR